MIYTKKIHNDVLHKIKEMANGSYVYKKDLIKELSPPYSEKEIIEALDYLSHSQVEEEDIKATIQVVDTELSTAGNITKDKMIWII